MSGFFSSIANKAQSALSSTPLAQHIPGSSPQGASGSGESASGTFKYSHTLESLHHQLRTFQQQYSSSTTPVQKIITTQKGIAIDYDNVSRDAQGHSKEFYLWGQQENEDLKDVTDRLAWLSYIHGQLANNLAKQLDASRAPFKALRDAETAIAPRRAAQTNLENQIGKLEHENSKAATQRISELKGQLHKAQVDAQDAEREIEVLKRKALRESELIKWQAIREYGEKLALLSQAATTIVPVLPSVPPSPNRAYTGDTVTANVRASLQRALDTYTPRSSNITFPEASPADLHRSDTRSFGETHKKELASIGTTDPSSPPGIPLTPPATSGPSATYPPPTGPPPQSSQVQASPGSNQSVKSYSLSSSMAVGYSPPKSASSPRPGTQSPAINPAQLNQEPAAIPIPGENATPAVSSGSPESAPKVSTVLPTVAEAGVPKSAGPDGPGPISGSLLSIKQDRNNSGTSPDNLTGQLSAEDEKKKLEREERERLLRSGGSPAAVPGSAAPHYESAEEEKKRLEREERERILREGGSSPNRGLGNQGPPPSGEGDGDLPPYEAI